MTANGDTESERRRDVHVSRRAFLSTTAAGLVADDIGRASGTQQVAKRFFIGGKVTGWQSLEQGAMGAGKVNPTLNLTAGKRYEVTWKNLDGAPHNFVIKGTDGKTLVSTAIMSEKGATQTVRFTATEEMDEYLCQVHPTTMHGQVTVASGGARTTTANRTTTQRAKTRQTETTTARTPTQRSETTTTQTTTQRTEKATTTTARDGAGRQIANRFFIGGRVSGWQALRKGPINTGTNPTLNLTPGERYEVTWKNLDGAPHNFTIRDAQGNELLQTRTATQKGATVTTQFTASEKMDTYVCTIHPTTMQGNVRVGARGGAAAGGARAGRQGGQRAAIPDTATSVAMLWTAALSVTVGLAAFILRYFDHLDEPSG